MNAHPTVSIQFSDDEGRVETLAAESLGESLYKMQHSPSFAYGVSLHDIFRARETEAGDLIFSEVVEKSGNRTMRMLLTSFSLDSPEIVAVLQKLDELGCSYENLLPQMVCINVPAEVEISLLAEALIDQHVWWEFADPDRRS